MRFRLVQSTFKIITISDTVIKTRFVFGTRNRLTIFSMDTVPTKITTWIAYGIIAYIHNYTMVYEITVPRHSYEQSLSSQHYFINMIE